MKTHECVPDWRWMSLIQAQKTRITPQDPFLLRVYNVMMDIDTDEEVSEALTHYHIPFKRDTLISFFLSKATLDQTHTGTWVKTPVLEIFEKLFVDPEQFRDKMDLRMYAQFYRDTICVEEYRPVLDMAVAEGPYALLQYWATGNELVRMPDDEFATKLAMAAYVKVMATNQESILSAASQESLKWLKAANQLLNARNRLNPTPKDNEDLLFGIKDREVTTPIGLQGTGFDISDVVH